MPGTQASAIVLLGMAGYLAGVTGTYKDPEGYFVDDADAEAFDACFSPKEKRRLPGQLE